LRGASPTRCATLRLVNELRHTGQSPASGARMHEDHADLRVRFEDLCLCAIEGRWTGLAERAHAIVADLKMHFAFEEAVLFPVLAARSRDGASRVRHLVADHAAMLQIADAIATQIESRSLRHGSIEVLADLLREHTMDENALFGPAAGSDRASKTNDAPDRTGPR